MKTENKLNPSHRASYSNRATPLMDLNLQTHNHPQTTTASIKPLTQHLAASQHWPSYISHSYQAPAAPQPPSCHIPNNLPIQLPISQLLFFFSANECTKAANDRNAPSTKPIDYDYEPGMATDNPPIKTVVTLPHMYSFIFLNVSRLFTKTTLKYKVLSDLCGPSTLFLCLCGTFLMDSINDSENPDTWMFYCTLLREGGGVCIYVRNTKSFSVCLKYSNSICDLLIVKTPSTFTYYHSNVPTSHLSYH